MNRTLPLLLITLLLVPGCKKSVEGESKRWTRNTAHVQELAALYPGFKTALKAQRAKAARAMKAAKAVSDKDQSAKKMAEANGMLSGGLVSKLDSTDKKVKSVRDKIVRAATAARDKNDRMAVRAATRNARELLNRTETRLKRGAPEIAAASAILTRAASDLGSAERGLDQVIRAAKNKARAKKAAARARATPTRGAARAKGAAASKPALVAQWTCEYCGAKNKAAATKCSNCGALKP